MCMRKNSCVLAIEHRECRACEVEMVAVRRDAIWQQKARAVLQHRLFYSNGYIGRSNTFSHTGIVIQHNDLSRDQFITAFFHLNERYKRNNNLQYVCIYFPKSFYEH